MHIHYISEQNSILNHFLAQLRDVNVQNDSMRFRKNMERIGEIMAYELSKKLSYTETSITTPLGTKDTMMIKDEVVLCSILRAECGDTLLRSRDHRSWGSTGSGRCNQAGRLETK